MQNITARYKTNITLGIITTDGVIQLAPIWGNSYT